MTGKTAAAWPDPEFPPWSFGVLVLWLVGFIVLLKVADILFTVAVIFVDSRTSGLSPEEASFLIRLLAYGTYTLLSLFFIHLQLKRKALAVRDIWIEYRQEPQQILLIGILAILYSFFDAMFQNMAIGPTETSAPFSMRIDWRLALGLQVLVEAVLIGVMEEVLFRGLIYRCLRQRKSIALSVCISSVVFTACHFKRFPYPLLLVPIFALGLINALLFERTRSLTPCTVFHTVFNASSYVIYYMN